MMSAEQRWGGLDPDMTISYTARSDSESKGRWKVDRKKRFKLPPPFPQYLFLQDNYKVRQ